MAKLTFMKHSNTCVKVQQGSTQYSKVENLVRGPPDVKGLRVVFLWHLEGVDDGTKDIHYASS